MQFAPLAYTIKLYIELVMTSLIARVVGRETVTGQAAGDSSSRFPSFQPPMPMGHDRYGDKYGSTKSIFGDASIAPPTTPKLDTQSLCSVAALSHHTVAADVEGRCEAPGDEVFLTPVPESSIIKTVTTTVVSEDKSSSPTPLSPPTTSSAVGSIKSHKSHKSHKSRLRSGAYEDWINDPAAPPTPPAKDGPPVALTRTKSRRARHPLTSRFNQN